MASKVESALRLQNDVIFVELVFSRENNYLSMNKKGIKA